MPRWIIFLIDVSICLFALTLAYLLRFNFKIPGTEIKWLKYVVPIVLGVRIASFLISKIYAGIIRYTGNKDAVRVFITIISGSVAFVLINIATWYWKKIYIIPFSILIIEFLATVFTLIFFRIFVKTLYLEISQPSKQKRSVIIFGAGDAGMITKRAIDRDNTTRYKVIAFLDDDERKRNKRLEGLTIYNTEKDFDDLIRANNIAHLIISIQQLPTQRKQEIIDKCLENDIRILNVPPVNNWINGELSFNQIKKIKIEDLLERAPIQLDIDKISAAYSNKCVLITGGAGSIGSELARQIIRFHPSKLVLLDQAESALYETELEIREKYGFTNLESVIGDVCSANRMRKLFETFSPQIVFHAAAYKHVPVMENNPSEGVHTNILGTKIIADLASEFNVQRFVMISTDKAVNPTSIMGATKRVAEIYCQSLNKKSNTQFITTRFGNVLDSNGSVIPRFKKQIEEGGPLTVTHPDVTRFFMTIPEAGQLVIEAGAMGNGGEIFLFDMGSSVRINDLAEKMIKLSGLTVNSDIKITYTGLRPGEKLYEELLNASENSLPTHHQKIMIARVKEYELNYITDAIVEINAFYQQQDNVALVKSLKAIVPEYKSQNSEYEKFD